ncbi:MAG TPA: cation:proton antiporter, partial [Leptospiraceae bacterium]|nr:cation:proton antiporter [Leptospiraceae bacterium]
LSIYLYPKFSLPKVSFLSFGLFMGIAMSVTAFPVLARILQEKGFARTQVGAIVITAAAIDDISAWIMLALIIAVIHSGGIIQSFALIGFVLLYAAGMIFVLRPFLNKLGKVYITKEYIGRGVMTFLVTIMMFSALTTEVLGIHALFGAFLAGVIMPSDSKLRMTLRDKFEDFSAVVLLPLFFAYTGLRTQIGLISTTQDLLDTLIIILAAVAGKFGGGMAAARLSGIGWKDSGIIGTLMNTRGLMELVVLNIGYDLGILSPKIFAMMVLMALITTFMTSPVLDLFKRNGKASDQHRPGNFPDLLITFGPPKSGEILFRLAHSIFGRTVHYSALHISPIPETISLDDPVNLKEENFSLIRDAARKSDVQITPIFKMTNNTSLEIVNTIQKSEYSMVFMGGAKKIFGDNV